MEFEMQKRGLTFAQMLYSGDKVRVYEVRNASNDCFVAKDMTFPIQTPYEKACNEVQVSYSLDHPNIMKCLDSFYYYSSQTTWQLVLVFEKMPKDLMREVRDRSQQRYPWTEAEVLHIFAQLIDAFAYMQQQGVCHRDIKPQNILVNGTTVKVTDFGTSKRRPESGDLQTMAGTPFFLSPQLKAGLLERAQKVSHDVYRSDVYSLGLTFLTMLKLEPPTALTNVRGLEQATDREIQSLQFSQSIKSLLQEMLKTTESERVDFLQLQEYFRKMTEASENVVKEMEDKVKVVGCEHVQSGAVAVVMFPCHGYLCNSCAPYSYVSRGSYQFLCSLCSAAPAKENINNSENTAKSEDDLVGFSEYKGGMMVCSDCRHVKNRRELVPVPGSKSLRCLPCQGIYEEHYRQRFGQNYYSKQ